MAVQLKSRVRNSAHQSPPKPGSLFPHTKLFLPLPHMPPYTAGDQPGAHYEKDGWRDEQRSRNIRPLKREKEMDAN